MDVKGLDELLAKLEDLPLTVGKTLIASAVRKGAAPILARAQDLAPVRSGRLKESMMITVTEQTATEAIAKIGPSRRGFYGTFSEFGTSHMAAHSFLRPAFEQALIEAQAIVGETLRSGIERVMVKEIRKFF